MDENGRKKKAPKKGPFLFVFVFDFQAQALHLA